MSLNKKVVEELNKTNHSHIFGNIICRFCNANSDKEDHEKCIPNITYMTPFEVSLHNNYNDLWVSFLGKVYNLTPLIREYADEKCIEPLLAFAGKDLSNWFDESTGEIQHFIHPVTGAKVPFCPYGLLPDVNTQVPNTKWKKKIKRKPWWANSDFLVGYLTKRVRPVRVQNMLSKAICTINVCKEDTLQRILERFQLFNSDADSYTWYYDSKVLDMTKTLEENGILDYRDDFEKLGMPENSYIPMLLLYYNDDLKHP